MDDLNERRRTFREGIALIQEIKEVAEENGMPDIPEAAERAIAMLRAWFDVVNEREAVPMSDNDGLG